jgi:predicted ester cyclase
MEAGKMTGNARDTLIEFYTKVLTVNAETSVEEALERILADDFRSVNGQETKDKATLIRQVEFFWKLIQDLKWEPRERIVEDNKVVVHSAASGSPKGDFMGLTLDGGKSFKIDTIDIHTVENGQIKEIYHLEDWAPAIRQLKG